MKFWSKKKTTQSEQGSRQHCNPIDEVVCFEPLEPRLLLSGSWGTGSDAPSQDANSMGDGSGQTAALHEAADVSGLMARQPNGTQVSGRVDLLAEAAALDALKADLNLDETSSDNHVAVPIDKNGVSNSLVESATPSLSSSVQKSAEGVNANEIILIDTGVQNYTQMVDDILANSNDDRRFEIILLETHRDGVDQISEALVGLQNIDAVHFVSHGSAGAVNLGTTVLSDGNLEQYADKLIDWQRALAPGADLLFYGCDLAADDAGEAFLNNLGTLLGADVAASSDLTGDARLGGDWVLEYGSGKIETDAVFSPMIQENWSGVLATFNVDTTADTADANPGDGLAEDASGNTSLRAAIMEANSLAGEDTINLAADTYTLSLAGANEDAAATGDLDITSEITINGAGAGVGGTVIDGGGLDRVFDIDWTGDATISNLSIQDGGNVTHGGGIRITGGGGGGRMQLEDVAVRNNEASISGAGIFSDGVITMEDVEISGNSNSQTGGGLHNTQDAMLTGVTISGNSADEGAGIFNSNQGNSLSLTNSTISGNTASVNGGGLYTAELVTMTNVTLAFNLGGGGIYVTGGQGDVQLKNSILASNTGGNSNIAVTSLGYNIEDGNAAFGPIAGDLQNTNPQLGALADNGGPTQTHALLITSPAIDPAGLAGAPGTDQRGFARDTTPDIGAVEYNASTNNPGTVTIDNTSPDQGDTLTASVSDADGVSGAITYQWYRNGAPIASANTASYTTVQADVGTVITVTADYTDDATFVESLTSAGTAAVTNVNDAPTLTGVYAWAGTDEDTISIAVPVSVILADGSITYNDPDGDTIGIAVYAADGQGNWQYSTDGAGGWTDFGAVNPNAALLLSETTWVRYVPDGLTGENAGFDFRAWDKTTGAPSTTGLPRVGNTTPGGGASAYSTGSAGATLVVDSVNDEPQVVLNNAMTAIFDDVDTNSAIKVADIAINDDSMGTNVLSLGGADAAMFQIVGGNELYLRAGIVLDPTVNPILDVSVSVDDTSVGGTPDDEASLSIVVHHVNRPPTATHLNTAETFIEEIPVDLTNIVVSDIDSPIVTVTLTLTDPSAGSLSTGTSEAVTSTFSGGTWSASGAIANVNILLAQTVFIPAPNFDGNFTIATSVSDGLSAPVTGMKIITGTPVGDTPQVESIATMASTQSGLIVIDRNPDDGAEVTHFRITGIANGALYLSDGTTAVNDGDFITVAQGRAGVRFSPTVDSMENGSFSVESSEDGFTVARQSGASTAVISVIPPSSPPTTEDTEATEGDEAEETDSEVASEETDPVAEPEAPPEEEVQEAVINPVKSGPAGKPALLISGSAKVWSSFLIQAGQHFGQTLVTGVDAQQSEDDQADNGAVRPDRTHVDPGPELADRLARSYNRMVGQAYLNMLNTFNEVKEEMVGDIAVNQTVLGSAVVMSTGLSVGYVVWMIRGGMLISSLLSSLPAWQILDPLPVLARKNDDEESDDESLESILDQKPPKDEMKKKTSEKPYRPREVRHQT